MSKNTCVFFATRNDLLMLLENINKEHSIAIFIADWLDTPVIKKINNFNEITPGINYLIASSDININLRLIPQRDGSLKYAIDQLENPETIALEPGGLISNQHLVAGQLGTSSLSPLSLYFYKIALKTLKKRFSKIKAYYVGPEAQILLDKGFRLSRSAKSPASYDLTRD